MELPPHVQQLLGPQSAALRDALSAPSPVSIRHNPLKQAAQLGLPVPWCAQGRYLEERPVFTLDPLLHAGAYYVQEASSMLLEQAVRACTGLPEEAVALDLCAAPGGKASHLAALLHPDALLVANEPVRSRQPALLENLWKWGRPGTVITGADPAAFRPLGAFCDLVLVDAPCSGEGMFRKDPFARAQWGDRLVESCAARQQHILDAAWGMLRPGGCLVYSTCTWETCENEDQVVRLLRCGAEEVRIPLGPGWGVERSLHGVRCYPHRLRGEGLFMAVLRKPGRLQERVSGAGGRPAPGPADAACRQWLRTPATWTMTCAKEVLHAVDQRWSALVDALSATVPVLAQGTPVARRKGTEWAPHAALALSTVLAPGAFPAIDLDRADALRFLHGESLPAKAAQGFVLASHQGLGLGWLNGAGNHWNNKWPAPWRIRMR